MDIKNFVLKCVTMIITFVFLISGCMLDSLSYFPLIIWCISASYLILFILANVIER